jgi:ribonuclease Y
MSFWLNILEGAVLLAAGAALCYALIWWKERGIRNVQAVEAQTVLDKARAEAEIITRDARLAANEEARKLREEVEQSFTGRRAERAELERRLSDREGLINSQLQQVVQAEKSLVDQKAAFRARTEAFELREKDLEQLLNQGRERLKKAAGMQNGEAKVEYLKQVQQEAQQEANALAHQILEDAKTRAEEKAKRIISVAIQRYAGEHTFENTTATITLNGDEIKGRIIGREGRNIRAFEAATGVTVLIDDTPGAVLLSGFDPVRREVARESMVRLIEDGRIHPSRIEEIVEKVKAEMDETILRLGDEAVTKAGVAPVHLEVLKLLGRLHFRHSYSQNILDHSVEVAHLMGIMAAELGLEVQSAKRSGLLHDIGKAVNHEIEGPHAVVGADLIKRHGESDVVVNAVASHHNDVPPIGPLGILVGAADAISASRPGARSESMTTYLKRVGDLEKIAAEFQGVEKAYAVQAGRELRVFVQPEAVNDEQAFSLARSIASKIENELQYPGQIRVTVIRETRCMEVAR